MLGLARLLRGVLQFIAHDVAGAGSEDQAFEQGIAGQAIGAVNAGGCGFSGGVEAREGGAAIEIS